MVARVLIGILVSLAFLVPHSPTATGKLNSSSTLHDLSSTRQLSHPYSPQEIRTAYDFGPLYDRNIDGTGQTVALIEIDQFNRADIHSFDSLYSLDDPVITETYSGGRAFPLEKSMETTMDIQWLHALAPGAAIAVYYVNNHLRMSGLWRSMGSAVQQAADVGAGAVSISLGACRAGAGADYMRAALRSVMRRGVTVFVSSGDDGDRPGTVKDCGKKLGVGYPAGDPSVVSVGGTSLQLTASSTIATESAWNKSGGGRSLQMLRTPWQTAPTMKKDQYRWAPDVSFLGDQNTGVATYFDGRTHQVGGTSLGAPCWAAVWSLIRQSAQENGTSVGSASKLLYRIGNSSAYKRAFHDVTTGSNGHYKAGVGWDAVTGWGTPDAAQLSQSVQRLLR